MTDTTVTDEDYLLPCGRGMEQVWRRLDAVQQGRADAHEARCGDCRAARESLLALRAATQELIDEPDPPPPDLFGRIMFAVRAEVRRGQTLLLPTEPAGSVQISEEAVATVMRFAADTVPGVRARRCRIRSVGTGPQGENIIQVAMSIAVRIGEDHLDGIVPQVRQRVAAAVSARTGLLLGRLDVTVADVYQEKDR
ncbi:Asp23/Gls24 family envelope stress response protein [Nocardia sp. 2]|uniref:Asp23/Gls24 family envelope stress response protein n=1 Tax=Nocardia acididurans TaxID=2802282 RepID=A0ABS1M7A1_9NOCA|nr:Asp23/Gls24 family envelope stress response protein [Nocardia acididurans]MBL1076424.1 Asp23/Gls24 family envelope stress response protein [Nocardia acididurans]